MIRRATAAFRMAPARRIVDDDAWLDIIAIDVKANTGALILNRFRLDLHAPSYELLSLKDRRHPIQYVISKGSMPCTFIYRVPVTRFCLLAFSADS